MTVSFDCYGIRFAVAVFFERLFHGINRILIAWSLDLRW